MAAITEPSSVHLSRSHRNLHITSAVENLSQADSFPLARKMEQAFHVKVPELGAESEGRDVRVSRRALQELPNKLSLFCLAKGRRRGHDLRCEYREVGEPCHGDFLARGQSRQDGERLPTSCGLLEVSRGFPAALLR